MAYKEKLLDKIIRLCNGGLNNSSISKKDVLKSILAAIGNHLQEPVSEDLEKEIDRFFNAEGIPVTKYALRDTARHFAQWQKEQILDCSTTLQRAYELGKQEMKQQMMEKAVDAQCFGFQGAALFSFRLSSDNYLVGSEVKVIVIKEN